MLGVMYPFFFGILGDVANLLAWVMLRPFGFLSTLGTPKPVEVM